MKTTNFDRYLNEQLQDPAFAARCEKAGEAWDVAIHIIRSRARIQFKTSRIRKKRLPTNTSTSSYTGEATAVKELP